MGRLTGRTAFVIALFMFAAATLSGCGYTEIGKLQMDPAAYEGKQVRLKGQVVSVNKIPIIGVKTYTLDDGTGELTISTEGELPALDETITVKGVVENTAIVGGKSLGFNIREVERK